MSRLRPLKGHITKVRLGLSNHLMIDITLSKGCDLTSGAGNHTNGYIDFTRELKIVSNLNYKQKSYEGIHIHPLELGDLFDIDLALYLSSGVLKFTHRDSCFLYMDGGFRVEA